MIKVRTLSNFHTLLNPPFFVIRYFIFLFLIQSCRGREVDLPLAFEGEKLVLWGKLEAGKPAEIKVSKTFMPMGLIPEDIQITHAEVFLFKNGGLIEKLSESEGSINQRLK
jgi:hypothetical protein